MSYEDYLFFKNVKFGADFRNRAKTEEKVVVFYVIAFKLVAANSHYYDDNTCHPQSVC